MVYSREVLNIQNLLQTKWTDVRSAFARMEPSSDIRPLTALEVFRPDSSSPDAKFDVGPVVFHVPERASDYEANIYVVVKGWISFGQPTEGDTRRTTLHFGTEVGYFRVKGDTLEHVYGVHYDMDEVLPGHPVFHAQLRSRVGMSAHVDELFHTSFGDPEDHAASLLRNVRTPTAQMDVFSVITQIGADHLMAESSGTEVHAAFQQLREACDFFIGAAGRLAYLSTTRAANCYRSTHWYERAEVA